MNAIPFVIFLYKNCHSLTTILKLSFANINYLGEFLDIMSLWSLWLNTNSLIFNPCVILSNLVNIWLVSIMLVPHNWAQLCITTYDMISYDW